ncbi:allantoinase AllB [Rubripirellula amarantea]|nr:allantoinase AllB [Rubripirellula amarantea]
MAEPSTAAFAITSTRVVTPEGEVDTAIVIEGDKISELKNRAEIPFHMPLIDVGDSMVSPGIIDAHVHVNEPGRTNWEGFETATRAAAAGGVTTIIDMPLNSSPVTTTVEALRIKQAAAHGKCAVDVGFYGGLVPGNENDIAKLVDAGVMGIKAFLCDSGLDEFPAAGEKELRSALQTLQSKNVPLLAHAEVVGNTITIADPRSYNDYANSRPESYEIAAIKQLIDLCRTYVTPIHIVHLATSAALSMIAEAKAEGLPITVETCPHYLFFEAGQIGEGQTSFKCAPPIRDQTNRDLLRDAVASGIIETVGSDHSPCSPDLKCLETGDFSKAWGGIASLQLTLSVMWTIAKEAGWTPGLLAERLSHRPAEVFGLGSTKGRISPGFDADLVIWDPAGSFDVHGHELGHRHDVTPYENLHLLGRVEQTYLRGKLIYQAGSLVGDRVGKLLHRQSNCLLASRLNSMNDTQLADALETCCASKTWIQQMISGGPFKDDKEVVTRSTEAGQTLGEADWLEAFSAHPRIGDIDSLRQKYANTKSIAGNEQSGVNDASDKVLHQLSAANDAYYDKFGFIFIVCATGKSAAEMLAILEQRLPLSRDQELANAAVEQLKITEIRLRKLIP